MFLYNIVYNNVPCDNTKIGTQNNSKDYNN